MAKNKALKKLRGILEGMPCGGDFVELLDNAVAHEREQPEVQAAVEHARLAKAKADKAELEAEKLRLKSGLLYDPETGGLCDSEARPVKCPSEEILIHQARLAKAKADKAEWEVYMATEGLRLPSFVERDPETCAPILTVPEWAKPLAAGVDASQGEAGTRQNPYMALPEEPADAKQRAEELRAAEVRRVHDERLKRAIAQQEERRILGLAEDAQDQAERIRAAEERGFYQGRNQAWRLLMENQKRHPDTIKVSKAFLADLQRAILYMQKEC